MKFVGIQSLCFTSAREIRGNPIEAHIHELNPVDYAVAFIIEAGLRVVEVSISPAKIIHHIIKAQQTGINF